MHIKLAKVFAGIFLMCAVVCAKAQIVHGGDKVLFVLGKYDGPAKFKQLAADAIAKINVVINSKQFKVSIIQHQYNWDSIPADCTYKNAFSNNNAMFDTLFSPRNVGINLKIRNGFFLNLWKHYISHEVGVEITSIPNTIITNQWYINKNLRKSYPDAVNSYLNNILHEYCHIAGFCHCAKRYNGRDDTVPYAVGNIAESIAN